MTLDDTERLTEIYEVLDELEVLAEDHIILVEGPNDLKALSALGINGRMFMVQHDGGPLRAAEYVAENGYKAVILTDWDRKGEIIANDLSIQMSSLDIRFDTAVRARLSALSKKYVKDVESLHLMVRRLSDQNENSDKHPE
ncbi:MAG: Toprim subdomain protein [Candidatus Methanoplasma sp.]|jgi:5S rRNA maturation endonuclease (ribonuclease M5)|nr:Toprim subdomain protein [Candidatus Methanoplasma sp.]